MRVVIFSLYGNFSSIAERIGQEIRHENVLTIFYNKDYRKWWDGLLNKPDLKYEKGEAVNAFEVVNKFRPDFILWDMSGEGALADSWREAGHTIIGATEFCDFLEMNRWYGTRIFSTLGFYTPATVQAKTYKEAIDFIKSRKDQKERWVIKFNDNQGNFSSYVSDDILDMLEELEHFNESNRVDFTSGAIIQEYIEGIELSCEGWFNGQEFIDGFNYTMEEKKFLTGSLGPSTGCEGNLVWSANREEMIPMQLIKMTPLLRKYNYIGPFDVNNMIATEGHQYDGFPPIKRGRNYILEPTPRFGYDAIYTLLEGYKGRISDLFAGLANKELKEIKLENKALLGVRTSIPPYPYNDISRTEDKEMEKLVKKTVKYMEKSVEGTIVRIRDLKVLRNIWFQDIRLDAKNHRLVVNGTDSVIAVVTAQSDSIEEAKEQVYKIIKAIDAPDLQYRLDVGDRAINEIPDLVELQVLQQPEWLISSGEKKTKSLASDLELSTMDLSEILGTEKNNQGKVELLAKKSGTEGSE